MIRKWSYIENQKNCYNTTPYLSLKRLSKKHSFKVFRKTTRFKKYRLGISKPVRRWHTRKKRKTSFYMNSHILFSWIHHYLRHRQFVRFVQSVGLSALPAYLGSADWSIKNSFFEGAPYGFHSYSCSYGILNKKTHFFNKIFPNNIMLCYSRNSFIQFLDFESVFNSNSLSTNLVSFDKLCYFTDAENGNSLKITSDLELAIFEIVILHVLEFRKIFVMTIFLNTNFTKIWN